MNIYDKIARMQVPGLYEKKMYLLLNTSHYCKYPYETKSLGENMALISQVIMGYWKPRYLLDNTRGRAYEFMDGNECLTYVEDKDICWESLNKLPDEYVNVARNRWFHYPSFIRGYKNGVAKVQWQLNPDGRYFMDDDGYGMTSDKEVDIYGYIDREGQVVVPFRYTEDEQELAHMRMEAEQKVQAAVSDTEPGTL